VFPLDYIMNLPSEMRDEQDPKKQEGIWMRENIFKNVIMRRVIEIRQQKMKPKLGDILKLFRGSLKGKSVKDDPKAKEELRNKLIALYDDSQADHQEDDVKYNRLMSNFDRIQKVLSAQQITLDHLVKKVTQLHKRREERERNPQKLMQIRLQRKQREEKERSRRKEQDSEEIEELQEEDEAQQQLSRSAMVQQLDQDHLSLSEDDENQLVGLNRIAGKHKKDEVFPSFKSPMLEHGKSEEGGEESKGEDSDEKSS